MKKIKLKKEIRLGMLFWKWIHSIIYVLTSIVTEICRLWNGF